MHSARHSRRRIERGQLVVAPATETVDPAWLAAAREATRAFVCWRDAPLDHKRDAYAVYRAAADRESAAIDCLRPHRSH
jgi:hypothetical protein